MDKNRLSVVENLKALEYVIEDFLELKAYLDPGRVQPLKDFLFAQSLEGQILINVEGFHLARQLVLIDSGDPQLLDHMVFLNPEDGQIRVKRLR